LTVEVHRAERFFGEVAIDDPDGIVVDARFVDPSEVAALLGVTSPWITEPLLGHLMQGIDDGRTYRYRVDGGLGPDRRITTDHDHAR
jgi:hypothetical protein